ncbi:MAG TPA: 16S rRNA (cytidine(1402)-2'-O)-methyltransferase [Rhizomicrobium sp.]|nr:16S rRNA (cytidine(1402)-2'-O)-methyltransferase [Rhizomicrobium sp.]
MDKASEPNPDRKNSQSDLAPGLYVAATPIGNARDITLRALAALKACDAIAAEDTRVTAKLLAIHGVSKPLFAYNDHNAARERPRLIARLGHGERIVLVSDAGTPLISDPGYKLVREALRLGIHVEALPGASALLTALVISGLPTDRFLFAGFLPARTGERRNVLSELKSVPASLVFFESPQRLAESLADLAQILGGRDAAVCRELTKLHEETRRGHLDALAAAYADSPPPKGEVTIIVAPSPTREPDRAHAEALLEKALAFMPVRAAADLVADALNTSRRTLYERALALRSEHDE